MKKSFEAMAVEMQDQGLESRSEEFGDMAISHIQLPANFDPSPVFEAACAHGCAASSVRGRD